MHRLPVLVALAVALGVATVGAIAVAQDTPATPEVVQPGTPEILPELCPTTEGIATPVVLAPATPAGGAATPAGTPATPEGGAATPALFPCPTPEGSPAAATDLVTIEGVDIDWNPNEVTIPADTDVTVRVPNNGVIVHTFVVEALGIKLEIAPGETKEVVINAPAGTYEFICDVPGHEPAGMVGTLTVQ